MLLFISGTDTGIGKTWVTQHLLQMLRAQGQRAAGFKPIATGDRSDGVALLAASGPGSGLTLDAVNPVFFSPPLSPYTASVIEERPLEWARLDAALAVLRTQFDAVLIEGAGGILSPITRTETMRDMAARWDCPVLLVAPNRLGALSHVLCAVEALRSAHLRLAGILLNDGPPAADLDDHAAAGQTILRQTNLAVLEERLPGQVHRADPAGFAACLSAQTAAARPLQPALA